MHFNVLIVCIYIYVDGYVCLYEYSIIFLLEIFLNYCLVMLLQDGNTTKDTTTSVIAVMAEKPRNLNNIINMTRK